MPNPAKGLFSLTVDSRTPKRLSGIRLRYSRLWTGTALAFLPTISACSQDKQSGGNTITTDPVTIASSFVITPNAGNDPDNALSNAEQIRITLRTQQPVSGVSLQINNGSTTSVAQNDITITPEGVSVTIERNLIPNDGRYTFSLQSTNANTQLTGTAVVVIDRTLEPTTIAIQGRGDGETLSAPLSAIQNFELNGESGANVIVSLGTRELGRATLMSNGTGNIALPNDLSLPLGENSLTVITTDRAGNTTPLAQRSVILTVQKEPALPSPSEITLTFNGSSATNASRLADLLELPKPEQTTPPVSTTRQPSFLVKLTAEGTAQLETLSGTVLHRATDVDGDGFVILTPNRDLDSDANGLAQIQVISLANAPRNTNSEPRAFTVRIDTTPPDAPTNLRLADASLNASREAESDSTLDRYVSTVRPTFSATAADSRSGLILLIDQIVVDHLPAGSSSTATLRSAFPLSDGRHTIRVHSVNEQGLLQSTLFSTLSIDVRPNPPALRDILPITVSHTGTTLNTGDTLELHFDQELVSRNVEISAIDLGNGHTFGQGATARTEGQTLRITFGSDNTYQHGDIVTVDTDPIIGLSGLSPVTAIQAAVNPASLSLAVSLVGNDGLPGKATFANLNEPISGQNHFASINTNDDLMITVQRGNFDNAPYRHHATDLITWSATVESQQTPAVVSQRLAKTFINNLVLLPSPEGIQKAEWILGFSRPLEGPTPLITASWNTKAIILGQAPSTDSLVQQLLAPESNQQSPQDSVRFSLDNAYNQSPDLLPFFTPPSEDVHGFLSLKFPSLAFEDNLKAQNVDLMILITALGSQSTTIPAFTTDNADGFILLGNDLPNEWNIVNNGRATFINGRGGNDTFYLTAEGSISALGSTGADTFILGNPGAHNANDDILNLNVIIDFNGPEGDRIAFAPSTGPTQSTVTVVNTDDTPVSVTDQNISLILLNTLTRTQETSLLDALGSHDGLARTNALEESLASGTTFSTGGSALVVLNLESAQKAVALSVDRELDDSLNVDVLGVVTNTSLSESDFAL